ncbi:MAG: hypothetical protein HQL97_04800 [Magnetococcales bacterium]|nr:hypothetical protein [Magnetococcales bacterium]
MTFSFRALFTISDFSRFLRKIAQARGLMCPDSLPLFGNESGRIARGGREASGGLFGARRSGVVLPKTQNDATSKAARKRFSQKA